MLTPLTALTAFCAYSKFPLNKPHFFDVSGLVGKSSLRHLVLWGRYYATQPLRCMCDGPSVTAQLLLCIRGMPQLTHLTLGGLLPACLAPAADYAALTASSDLQQLDLTKSTLPAAAWQHVFPDSKRLPLRELTMPISAGYDNDAAESHITAADVSSIVSCCPKLRVFAIDMQRDRGLPYGVGKLPHTAEVLVPLRALSGLQTLKVGSVDASCLREVAGMTGLRELELHIAAADGSCGSSNDGLDGG
jgi:hypothetical protein